MKEQADVVVADEIPQSHIKAQRSHPFSNEINFAINAAKIQEHW